MFDTSKKEMLNPNQGYKKIVQKLKTRYKVRISKAISSFFLLHMEIRGLGCLSGSFGLVERFELFPKKKKEKARVLIKRDFSARSTRQTSRSRVLSSRTSCS